MGYYSSSNEQYIGPDGKSVKNWDIDDDNIELTAHWAVTNVVTFNMQGHGEQVATQYVEDGNKVELPTAPSATGYTFGGWFKEAGCTNEWNFDDTIDDDLTLFAKWTPLADGNASSRHATAAKERTGTSSRTGAARTAAT